MTFLRQYLAKRFAAGHKSPLHGAALLGRIFNHRDVASGLCTEPPTHRKRSGAVTNNTLSLLLPNNQGKYLPRSQLQDTYISVPGQYTSGGVGAA